MFKVQGVGSLVFGMIALFLLAACGSSTNQPVQLAQADCSSGAAQIGLGAGYAMIVCGCQEAKGVVQPPSILTCTVPVNTQVFFQYMDFSNYHQIVPNGQPGFEPAPPNSPLSEAPVRVHAVQFKSAGTYGFKDFYFESLQGRIVVQ
jgi:hypothetical protein